MWNAAAPRLPLLLAVLAALPLGALETIPRP